MRACESFMYPCVQHRSKMRPYCTIHTFTGRTETLRRRRSLTPEKVFEQPLHNRALYADLIEFRFKCVVSPVRPCAAFASARNVCIIFLYCKIKKNPFNPEFETCTEKGVQQLSVILFVLCYSVCFTRSHLAHIYGL